MIIKMTKCNDDDNISTIFTVQRSSIVLKKNRKGRKYQVAREIISKDGIERKCNCTFYGTLTLLILIGAPFSFTLIPLHNIHKDQKYWYELAINTLSYQIFCAILYAVTFRDMLRQFVNISTARVATQLFLTQKGSEVIGFCIIHIIWSDILGFYEPFPFRQTFMSYVSLIVIIVRCQAFIYTLFWFLFVAIQLTAIVTIILPKISRDIQWIVAFVFPLTKELNDRIIGFLIAKAVSSENLMEAKFIGKIVINLLYSFWAAITLINIEANTTEILLLAINFLINMRLCYQIILLERKVSGVNGKFRKDSRKRILTELVLNEFVEIVIPTALIGVYSIFFFGPQNVVYRDGIDNLQSFVMPIVEMALIDSTSVILAGILLWRLCRINILQEYNKIINKYWIYMASHGGAFICLVRVFNI